MKNKMTTNLQPTTTEPKEQKLSKQLEQNHRNGDHMEDYQWGGKEWGEKVQGIRSTNGRYKIDLFLK